MRFWLRWAIVTLPVMVCFFLWARSYRFQEDIYREGYHNEFSLGASGYLYEKGSFKHPVRGVIIAGLLQDMLKKIVAVGDDLTWYTSTGAPSFLVSEMMIAGT